MKQLISVCAGIIIVWAILVAIACVILSRQTPPPLYRFCNGHLQKVTVITPCPTGELRIII